MIYLMMLLVARGILANSKTVNNELKAILV
jgi:hypothetical protein